MKARYGIELFWSTEDEVWIADVPDLPFCSGHGATTQDALRAVEEAAEAWLSSASATGRTIPEPSRRTARA